MIQKPSLHSLRHWFFKRGLQQFDHQINSLKKVNDSLFGERNPTVLAACPSAGKTLMTIAYIDLYLEANPEAKVLILTHGTDVLRSQFFEAIIGVKVGFTTALVNPMQKSMEAQVIVSLPQTLTQSKKLPRFDLIIVDEAHHYYLAAGGQIERLIRRVRPKHQLLLTGTPSKFIEIEWKIIPVTVGELVNKGLVTDVVIELASSVYDFHKQAFNKNGDLVKNLNWKTREQETSATLDDLLRAILNRLTSINKNNPRSYATNKALQRALVNNDWSIPLKALRKTMFACESIEQAQQVKTYMDARRIKSVLSDSKTDPDNKLIPEFVLNKDITVLIVVDRGILGFNLPELENVIDMTCSRNPDVIFQLMGRVLRKHPNDKQKLFFKVVPAGKTELYRAVMQATLCLTHEKYYTTYNGKNFLDQMIMEEVIPTKRRKKSNRKEFPPEEQREQVKRLINFEGVPSIQLLNDLLHHDKALLNGYAWNKVRNVINRLNGYIEQTYEQQIQELYEAFD